MTRGAFALPTAAHTAALDLVQALRASQARGTLTAVEARGETGGFRGLVVVVTDEGLARELGREVQRLAREYGQEVRHDG